MRGYNLALQPDELTLAHLINRLTRGGTLSIDDAIAKLDNDNQPVRLSQRIYSITPSVSNTPQLLVPANPRRASVLVANLSVAFAAAFSFRYPLTHGNFGRPLGIVIPGGGAVQSEINGTATIDDVWAWCPTGNTSPIIAFEGTVAVQ